ncbi:MAG: NADH-quinone oxidoreductase subunit J [Verrucomicrobiales bacterium]|jgi:NADH-quinone oxidoreductase subunit J
MLVFGVMVVVNRNPVASALSLVVSFLGLAALFISLDAYFIGIVQILVYAGAVMVLFLFIIMLLDLKAEARRKINLVPMVGGGVLTLALVVQLIAVLSSFEPGKTSLLEVPLDYAAAIEARPALPEGATDTVARDLSEEKLPDVRLLGELLFTKFPFHLQIAGVLLLVSTVGVVILSKRELK